MLQDKAATKIPCKMRLSHKMKLPCKTRLPGLGTSLAESITALPLLDTAENKYDILKFCQTYKFYIPTVLQTSNKIFGQFCRLMNKIFGHF